MAPAVPEEVASGLGKVMDIETLSCGVLGLTRDRERSGQQ